MLNACLEIRGVSWLLHFAAQRTGWENVKAIPKETWINLLLCIVTVFVVVRLWRTLKKLNDYAPYLFAVFAASGVLFFWVYERTEPRFLTPVVEPLTHFLPTKAKQQTEIDRWQKGRKEW